MACVARRVLKRVDSVGLRVRIEKCFFLERLSVWIVLSLEKMFALTSSIQEGSLCEYRKSEFTMSLRYCGRPCR